MKKLILLFMVLITILSFSFQIDKNFPVVGDEFDDSVLTNQIFEFKGYNNQGYIILTYNNLKDVHIYINGHLIDTSKLKGNGQAKIYIGKYTKNDKNIFSVSNLEGKLNVKIPYPVVIEKSTGNFNKT